jgi:Toprim domain
MGSLLGHAVRFGAVDDALAVREGIEAMLSLSLALPAMPAAAALPANHLAALLLPPTLRRLYIARDADAIGDLALAALTKRAAAAGIEALALSPRLGDFNEDLQAFGLGAAGGAAPPARATGCRAMHAPGNGHGGLTDGKFGSSRPIRRRGRPNCSGSAVETALEQR